MEATKSKSDVYRRWMPRLVVPLLFFLDGSPMLLEIHDVCHGGMSIGSVGMDSECQVIFLRLNEGLRLLSRNELGIIFCWVHSYEAINAERLVENTFCWRLGRSALAERIAVIP